MKCLSPSHTIISITTKFKCCNCYACYTAVTLKRNATITHLPPSVTLWQSPFILPDFAGLVSHRPFP